MYDHWDTIYQLLLHCILKKFLTSLKIRKFIWKNPPTISRTSWAAKEMARERQRCTLPPGLAVRDARKLYGAIILSHQPMGGGVSREGVLYAPTYCGFSKYLWQLKHSLPAETYCCGCPYKEKKSKITLTPLKAFWNMGLKTAHRLEGYLKTRANFP